MAGTRTGKVFKGCAIGCGLAVLIGFGSCTAFVMWVNQPGELIDTALLCSSDARGFAEWELSLDDPGTEQLVMSFLDSAAKMRGSLNSDLPPTLDAMLKRWQSKRDEKKVREMFPLVVAWSLRPGVSDDIHQVTLSIERLGNQMLLMDWVLGWAFERTDEVRVTRHRGEKIYQFDPSDAAFFMRRSDVVFSTDLESAQQLVDRLGTRQTASPGTVHNLLAQLPQGPPLRAAMDNNNGELQRILDGLAQIDELKRLAELEWSPASSLVLTGGFTDSSSFSAQLELQRDQGPWKADAASVLEDVLTEVLGGETTDVLVKARIQGSRLNADVTIPDLPQKIDNAFGLIGSSITTARDNPPAEAME